MTTQNMDITQPSICIPRVFPNISHKEIKTIFETIFQEKCIQRIDIVGRNNKSQNYTRVFIHFKYWPDTEKSNIIRNRLLTKQTVNIVYNEPWFWKCSASRVPKPNNR